MKTLTNYELLSLNSSILARRNLDERDVLTLCAIVAEFQRRDSELFTLKNFVPLNRQLNGNVE